MGLTTVFIFQVYNSRRRRAGKGKMRNRRSIQRRGPLIVYGKDQVCICFLLLFYIFSYSN